MKDGLELLTLMKSFQNLKDIPVIMMSSDGEMENVAICMERGAADYIIKPIRHILSILTYILEFKMLKNLKNTSILTNRKNLYRLTVHKSIMKNFPFWAEGRQDQ